MRYLVFIIAVMIHFGCAVGQQGRKIEIEFKDLKDTALYLVHYYGNSNMIADTAMREKSGRYIFSGRTKLPEGVYILVDESKSKSYFEILIDGQQHFKIRTDTVSPHNNLSFVNSPVNSTFREYTKFLGDKRQEVEKLRKSIKELKEDVDTDHSADISKLEARLEDVDRQVREYQENIVDKDPASMLAVLIKLQWEPVHPYDLTTGKREDSIAAFTYTREHYWDHIDLSDERIVRTPIFHEKLKTYMTVLVLQHPDSVIMEGERIISQTVSSPDLYRFVVWYIVNMTERSNIMGMEAAFVHFAKEYYLSGKTWWASPTVIDRMAERVRVLERILIGAVAPELQMWDTNKTVTSLHRVNADFTVVVFWDYECGHCNRMLPKLRDYYHKMKNEGLEVFAVCTKTDLDKWKKYIRERNLDWINVNGGYSVNRYDTLYDIMSTPIVFLLDKDKRILAKKIEVDQLKEILSIEMEKARNSDGILRKD